MLFVVGARKSQSLRPRRRSILRRSFRRAFHGRVVLAEIVKYWRKRSCNCGKVEDGARHKQSFLYSIILHVYAHKGPAEGPSFREVLWEMTKGNDQYLTRTGTFDKDVNPHKITCLAWFSRHPKLSPYS